MKRMLTTAIAVLAIALCAIAGEQPDAELDAPAATTATIVESNISWSKRAKQLFETVHGQEVTDAELELILNMFWLANAEQQGSDDQKAELFVRSVGGFIGRVVEEGAKKQGVAVLRRRAEPFTKRTET